MYALNVCDYILNEMSQRKRLSNVLFLITRCPMTSLFISYHSLLELILTCLVIATNKYTVISLKQAYLSA